MNLYYWKILVLRSCDPFVMHPDTRSLTEVSYQVVNHEGSVIVSCVTSIELGLIHPHSAPNSSIPDCGRLIYSTADHPNKYQNKKIEPVSKLSDNVYVKEVQDENKQQQFPAQADTVLQNRKCREVKSVYMQPQKPRSCELQSRKTNNQGQERTQRGSNCYAATQASN